MKTMKTDFYSRYQVHFEEFIDCALAEDIGFRDHSSHACIDADAIQKAKLLVKESCTIAGVALAVKIFERFEANINVEILHQDGEKMEPDAIAFRVEGPTRALLATERIVLNCMQRMSGIATFTQNLNNKISHTDCKLLDTRKTTPNFRYPEKWAVAIGGGVNHRIGLFDAIMIKDNHIDYCGGINKTLEKTKAYNTSLNTPIPVIVEARNENEVKLILEFPWVRRILLDNMPPETIKKCVHQINGRMQTEASGNITASNILAYAETGVDYISMGALTHSAPPVDLSLKAVTST